LTKQRTNLNDDGLQSFAPQYAHRLIKARRADRIALFLSWLYVALMFCGSIWVIAGGAR